MSIIRMINGYPEEFPFNPAKYADDLGLRFKDEIAECFVYRTFCKNQTADERTAIDTQLVKDYQTGKARDALKALGEQT